MTWIQSLTTLIAPPVCILCGGHGQRVDEPWGLDLCGHCEQACIRAGPEPPPFERGFCLFRYEDPVDQMIVRLKFQHEIAQARVLGTLFARHWRGRGVPLPECLIPMPLHRSRFRERGFCQVTQLAGHIAHRLRPLRLRTDLLVRTRATRAQSGLDAAGRALNLRGAFACRPLSSPPRHVALLDDVLTTGHTALAAIEALQRAGIVRVDLWTIARAALRDDPAGAPGPEGPIC